MSELKPCPFCGGEARLYPSEAGFFVGCFNDGCVVNPSSGEFVADGVWDEEQKEAAIDAWNTRAQTVFGLTLDEVRQMMKRDAERAERTCKLDRNGVCNVCGASIERITHSVYEMGDMFACSPRYCPNCGAKVVEE